MKVHPVVIAVAGALVLHAPAGADTLALPKIALDSATESALGLTPEVPAGDAAVTSGLECNDNASSAFASRTIFESVRWRPRRWRDRDDRWSEPRRSSATGFSQIHAGFLDPDGEVNERALDAHVSRLRKKLGPAVRIETVWGIGYRLATGGDR